MDKGISEIVGRGDLEEGGSTEVYRALRSLLCATCGASIAQNALFTRRKVKGIGLRIMPQCAKCAPFSLQADKKEKSALLESLLTKQPTNSIKRENELARLDSQSDTHLPNDRKSLDDEVKRRLGPALKRSRLRKIQK